MEKTRCHCTSLKRNQYSQNTLILHMQGTAKNTYHNKQYIGVTEFVIARYFYVCIYFASAYACVYTCRYMCIRYRMQSQPLQNIVVKENKQERGNVRASKLYVALSISSRRMHWTGTLSIQWSLPYWLRDASYLRRLRSEHLKIVKDRPQ